jgi:hypothetical protein
MLIMMLQRDRLDAMKPNDLLGEVLTFDKYDQDVDEKEKEEEKKKKTMAFKATTDDVACRCTSEHRVNKNIVSLVS